jgi:hypothetical protein
MKKIISLILTLVMAFSLVVPAVYAADEKPFEPGATPIIFLRGNGEAIHYENGTGEKAKIDIGDVLGDPSIYDVKGMAKEIVNIMIPFLTQGLLDNDWYECQKAVYMAISPFFEQSISDGDGLPQLKTTISATAQIENEYPKVKMNATHYITDEYTFHYDWRRDPYQNVDALHTYVLKVMENTGKKQVSFASRCLGGTLLNAYLEKYGSLGHVKNCLYGDTLGNGSTVLSKLFSGKLDINGKNVQRYQGQLGHCAEIGQGVGIALPEMLDELMVTTLDLLTQTNVTDSIGNGIEILYDDLLKVLLPALLHAIGYASTPNYWACVREEDFDEAIEFLFGKEGSEGRKHFKGLIEVVTNYNEKVSSKLPELYNKFINEYGIHIGTASKYGYLNMPLVEDNEILSDSLTSLVHASFGATAAEIGGTLSDSYIAARVAEGKGKYISPDKMVDVSTSISPDTAWVIKNCHHGYADVVFAIAEKFCNGTNVTVDTEGALPQFLMYEEGQGKWTEMTKDNCADLEFMALAETEPDLATRLASGLRFITMLINLFVKLIKGEISFEGIGSVIG